MLLLHHNLKIVLCVQFDLVKLSLYLNKDQFLFAMYIFKDQFQKAYEFGNIKISVYSFKLFSNLATLVARTWSVL